MAKKKKKEPEKETTCFRCDGTKKICNSCGESAAYCVDNCPDEEGNEAGYDDCPDCGGTGK